MKAEREMVSPQQRAPNICKGKDKTQDHRKRQLMKSSKENEGTCSQSRGPGEGVLCSKSNTWNVWGLFVCLFFPITCSPVPVDLSSPVSGEENCIQNLFSYRRNDTGHLEHSDWAQHETFKNNQTSEITFKMSTYCYVV